MIPGITIVENEDEALINRMGFPSAGAEVVSRALRRWQAAGREPKPAPRVGKGSATPLFPDISIGDAPISVAKK